MKNPTHETEQEVFAIMSGAIRDYLALYVEDDDVETYRSEALDLIIARTEGAEVRIV